MVLLKDKFGDKTLTVILRHGFPVLFTKYIIKKYNSSIRNFNIAIAVCSYMFRPLQINRYQAVCFGIDATFNCNLQLLYYTCKSTDCIRLTYVIFDCDNMYYIFSYFRNSAKVVISFKSVARKRGIKGLYCVCFANCGRTNLTYASWSASRLVLWEHSWKGNPEGYKRERSGTLMPYFFQHPPPPLHIRNVTRETFQRDVYKGKCKCNDEAMPM
jgi:hypothetical protein